MYKMVEYVLSRNGEYSFEFRVLDTRGGGAAVLSVWYVGKAALKLLLGHASGRLAGLHVNMGDRLSVFRKGLLVLLARRIGLPVVLHLHGPAGPSQAYYRQLPEPLRRLVRRIFAAANAVLVLGGLSRDFVIHELGVAAECVQILVNGVPGPTAPRRVPGSGCFRVLFLGNLREQKGVTDLLEALSAPLLLNHPLPWRATLAGGGDVEHYRRRADALGLADRVELAGWQDQREVAELLASADVLVLPSHAECLPLSVLEALGNGVAVVCTPVGEIPGQLTEGEHALFVSPGNVEALSTSLLRLMEDPALRERLESQGRRLYAERFSLDAFLCNLARVHGRAFGVRPPREALP